MKKHLVVVAAVLAAGCAGLDGEDGTSCKVVEDEIVCEDGTRVAIEDGRDGKDGASCTVTDNGDGSRTISCEDGTSVTVRDGVDGNHGEEGTDGSDGTDGTSCTVSDNGDGSRTITCEDGTSAVIRDGVDGEDGTSCTLVHNGNGTATLTCTDGTRAVIPLAECVGGFFAPGFDIGGPWPVTGEAIVDEAGPGHDGRGSGLLSGPALCNGDTITQTVCTGSMHDRGPTKLTVWQRADCTGCEAEAAVRIGGGAAVSLGTATDTWSQASVCLGEGAFGEAVSFAFTGPAHSHPACTWDPTEAPAVLIDDVALEQTTRFECPELGTVLNGDFESGALGWEVDATPASEVSFPVLADGAAVRLVRGGGCESAFVEGRVSVPLAETLPHAALQVRATIAGGPLSVQAGGISALLPLPLGSGETHRLCVPGADRGNVLPIRIGLAAPLATCTGAGPSEATVKDVRLVSDPTCP